MAQDEVEKIVQFWEEGKGDAKNRLILYNCTSGYPVRWHHPSQTRPHICITPGFAIPSLFSHLFLR
jgi:hypothetical protein